MLTLSLVTVLALQALEPSAVEPLRFQARAEPSTVRLGEPFTYELALTHKKELRYELSALPSSEAVEIQEQQRNRVDGENDSTTTFRVRMSAFELGKVRLPDLAFEVYAQDGKGSWVAKGIEIEVQATLPEDAAQKGEELKDIRGPEPVPVRTWRLLYALGGLLALAALAYGLYRFSKRERKTVVPVLPPRPLHERTVAALDSLRAENLPAQGRAKEFHFKLSEILRGYLGERYSFEALECTGAELLAALGRLHTPGLPMEELRKITLEGELVKFAKAEATADQCREALELGYRLVSSTREAEAAPAQKAGS